MNEKEKLFTADRWNEPLGAEIVPEEKLTDEEKKWIAEKMTNNDKLKQREERFNKMIEKAKAKRKGTQK